MDFEHGTVPYLLPLPYAVMVTVGNSSQVPIHFYSNMHLWLPSYNFVLKNVLLVPSLIKNLILVHQFTCDNVVSIEFDSLDFYVKDLRTRSVIICYNSSGNLYTIPLAATATSHHTHIVVIIRSFVLCGTLVWVIPIMLS
jgi:hypothetical protein